MVDDAERDDFFRALATLAGMTPTPARLARLAAIGPVVIEAAQGIGELDLAGVRPVLRFQAITETETRGSDNVSSAPGGVSAGSTGSSGLTPVAPTGDLPEGL
jgi:hypothetical protein